MPETYEFEMAMTCEGCANAARKVLAKLGDQVKSVEVSVPEKRVTVTTDLSSDQILETLKKTGKECKLVQHK